jgi:ABC-type glycerol-3-phosphate transport system permease component
MKRLAAWLLLLAASVAALGPFAWMLLTALKTLPEAIALQGAILPAQPQWRNFAEAFRAAPFTRYFLNTFAVSGIVAAAVLINALLAGYAFARLRFAGRGLLFGVVLATIMIPFEITLIPNFVLVDRLGWYNTYPALIVPWCANAFSIFLVRQAFLGIPQDYFDAARMDGCGHLRFLRYIGLPMIRPIAITVALFAFLGSYNALLWPLVVTSDDHMRMVQAGLLFFTSDAGLQLNLLMAAATIVILPPVLLYFLLQRWFAEDAISAGLKM